MTPTRLWLGCLAMAGSCLVAAGCGGSDVPDPASDSMAAAEPTAKVVDRSGANESAPEPTPEATPAPTPTPTPTPAPAAAPVVAAAPSEPKPEAATASTNPEPSPAAATPSPTETAAATPKADSSGTEEMLRVAGNTPSTPTATAGDAAAPTPAPGGAAPAPAPAAGPGEPAPGGGNARNRAREAAMSPAVADRTAPGGGETAMNPKGAMMPGGGRGQFGSQGGTAANDADPGPGAFRNPATAVEAFLKALKAKNKDRLSQATAKRAATESVEKHQKIFAAILDQSISDEELDDMAKALEGFQVSGILPAKSTGQIGVLINKMENRDRLQRTVHVRREKEGWKVMDFGGTIDFKPIGTYRRPFGRR